MKRLSEKTLWEGSSWRFRVETLALSDGNKMERGKIVHPGAVVLVPMLHIEKTPHIAMIRQFRHVLNETIFELPAGTRGWDEDWHVCAQRELQEETGYRAASFTKLGDIWPSPGVSDELMKLYLATGLQPDPLPADVDEEIEVVPMPLVDCIEMVQNGRIRDAKTIVGVWKTAVYLQHPL
ncbi:MAG: NUDIX hydrolase [Chloroflexi bacterium]|nr:MAG: NUDIX hydrolase [Chloroflexota bacterium]